MTVRRQHQRLDAPLKVGGYAFRVASDNYAGCSFHGEDSDSDTLGANIMPYCEDFIHTVEKESQRGNKW